MGEKSPIKGKIHMRKIKLKNQWYDTVVSYKDGDNVIELPPEPQPPQYNKFSPLDLLTIFHCNEILVKNNLPKLTEEEERFLIDPFGIGYQPLNITDLQKLSGFVEVKDIVSENSEWYFRLGESNHAIVQYFENKVKKHPSIYSFQFMLELAKKQLITHNFIAQLEKEDIDYFKEKVEKNPDNMKYLKQLELLEEAYQSVHG